MTALKNDDNACHAKLKACREQNKELADANDALVAELNAFVDAYDRLLAADAKLRASVLTDLDILKADFERDIAVVYGDLENYPPSS
jgi:hypothetical protein